MGVAKARARATKSNMVHLVTCTEVLESQNGPSHRLDAWVWLRLEL